MTGYEASQAMRRLETEVRNQKDIREFAKSSGDNVLVKKCNDRIKAYQAKYNEISEITGIAKQPKRMSVPKSTQVLTNSGNGGIINILPKVENAEIDFRKFTEYALNPEKDENKAKAFKAALGYTVDNVDDLISNIRNNIKNFSAVEKSDNGYGKRYEIIMTLTGENGKKANIKTAWIIDNETNAPRLTSAYVTSKKIKEE